MPTSVVDQAPADVVSEDWLKTAAPHSDPPPSPADRPGAAPGDHRGPRQSGLSRQEGRAGVDVLLHDLDLGVHPADGDAARQVDLGLRGRLADRYSLQIQQSGSDARIENLLWFGP